MLHDFQDCIHAVLSLPLHVRLLNYIAKGIIQDPVLLIEKGRGLSPGGRIPPLVSFIKSSPSSLFPNVVGFRYRMQC